MVDLAESEDGGTSATCGLLPLEPFDLAAAAGFVEDTSDLSAPALLESRFDKDALGLSDLGPPGIFDRMDPLNEREDSLVSDLLNEGYDWRLSPNERSRDVDEEFLGVLEPSLDCC